MRRSIFAIIALLFSFSFSFASQQWKQSIDGMAPKAVVADANNIYIVGGSYSYISGSDIMTVALSSNGDLLWEDKYTSYNYIGTNPDRKSQSTDWPAGISIAQSRPIVYGSDQDSIGGSRFFAKKYGSKGFVKSFDYGFHDEAISALALDNAIILSGIADIGRYANNAFSICLDNTGNELWNSLSDKKEFTHSGILSLATTGRTLYEAGYEKVDGEFGIIKARNVVTGELIWKKIYSFGMIHEIRTIADNVYTASCLGNYSYLSILDQAGNNVIQPIKADGTQPLLEVSDDYIYFCSNNDHEFYFYQRELDGNKITETTFPGSATDILLSNGQLYILATVNNRASVLALEGNSLKKIWQDDLYFLGTSWAQDIAAYEGKIYVLVDLSYGKYDENQKAVLYNISKAEVTTTTTKTATAAHIFRLDQNHPNPFNPSTTIRYSLPRPSRVKLEIFNISGQRVAELVDAHQPRGEHKVKFSAAHLPSGTYFCRIQAGDWIQTKKILHLK